MHVRGLIFTISLFVVSISVSFSQSNKLFLRKGNQCYKKGQYKNAYAFYEQILKSDPNNTKVLYRAGVCNLYRYSKEQALADFEKVYQTDSLYDKYLYYWLGRANHLNFKFDEAIRFYTSFLSKVSASSIQYKEVQRYIYQASCARDFVANPSSNYVRNLGPVVNSSFSDHSPITSVTDTFILFTSRRVTDAKAKEEYDGEPFEDIFFTSRNAQGEWSKPESFHLNTTGHDASIQLFDNDTKLYIYSYLHDGDIYLTEKVDGSWQTPVSFEEINSVDFEADAFMTKDGKTVYFASNHLKKNGDLDICFITKDAAGAWSKPQLLPSVINTDEDEDAPYITADGKTMYFSSRGHTSMGGYDVFRSVLDSATGKWTKPVNLGYPVNTPDDDLYFCLSSQTSRAFMSSYRTGGYGEKDIYEVLTIEQVQVEGLLVDEHKNRIDGAGYTITITPVETASKNAAMQTVNTSADGSFRVNCLSDNAYSVLVVHAADTLFADTLQLELEEEKNKSVSYTCMISLPKQADIDSTVVSVVARDTVIAKRVPVQQVIYFGSMISDLGPASKNELRKLIANLEKDSLAQITINGHADGSGPEKLNEKLSEKRALAVKEYLISKGISPARIRVASFGSQKPIASNDTDAGRAKNRRVEIIIE
ncbi:MAG: OmpA family protein [Cytophaga sp.]|uniref:OmpA family protein n=1 Tax=Cytophaga sp. TaxID=29535 RepID=UPI003F7FB95F